MSRFRIPLHGEDDLMWGYFLLQAARGGVRVPEWVLLSIAPIIGQRVGVEVEEVTGDDLDAALKLLSPDPKPVLRQLLKALELDLPVPGRDEFRLADDAALGSFRTSVGHVDLVHDAVLYVLSDYTQACFYACMDSLEDPECWDARGAVAAMLFLLVLKNG